MIINRCHKCEGRKNIVGLGNMIKKCTECLGVGHVKKEKPINETLIVEKFNASQVVAGVVKIDKRSKEYKDGRRKTDNLHA